MSTSASTLNQIKNNTAQTYYQTSQKNLGSSRLDREGFIRLILAQLQYQDPTNPQDSTQMLTQQLQLEQADQMKSVVDATKFAQAGSMVGKQADLVDARWDFNTGTTGTAEWDYLNNSPKYASGVIESVQFDRSHGKALVKINGNYYDAENILQLSAPPAGNTGGTSGAQ